MHVEKKKSQLEERTSLCGPSGGRSSLVPGGLDRAAPSKTNQKADVYLTENVYLGLDGLSAVLTVLLTVSPDFHEPP